MPPTQEVACDNDDCFVDMFENHYTYDVPEEYGIGELVCPVCRTDDISAIEV